MKGVLPIDGLMMQYELTLDAILRRAETLYPHREIVTGDEAGVTRSTYSVFGGRARKLAMALRHLGLQPGDRVATLCANHSRHAEAYFGIPLAGGVIHTLNVRLHQEELRHIIEHAGDRMLIADESLVISHEAILDAGNIERVCVIRDASSPSPSFPSDWLDYDALVDSGEDSDLPQLEYGERAAAAMCYTSGTTGGPKGVLYSHRSLVLHSLASCLHDALDIRSSDTLLQIAPLFHVNGWGFPYTTTMVGAKQVYPGSRSSPEQLLELCGDEGVTVTGCVPTVALSLLHALDIEPGRFDVSRLRTLIVAGSAAPQAMIEGFQERHGVSVVHAWGMTETSPTGCVSRIRDELKSAPPDVQYGVRAKQGMPIPFVEVRARNDDGLVTPDGQTTGELEVRGPWVARAYFGAPDARESFTADGWFRTGDIVTIDTDGYVQIRDRAKDLIKSGGEWISSVALETRLIGHPAIAEAVVIAVPDARWQERPLAIVVLKDNRVATADELRSVLEKHFAKWQIPDHFEFVTAIPKTSIGKYKKSALREQYAGYPQRVACSDNPSDRQPSGSNAA